MKEVGLKEAGGISKHVGRRVPGQITVRPISELNCCTQNFFFFKLRFLYEPNSKGYKYYRQKLEEFRKAKNNSIGTPFVLEPNLKHKSIPEATPSSSSSPASSKQPVAAASKKRRKSRWGPEEEKVDLPPPELAQQELNSSPSPLSG